MSAQVAKAPQLQSVVFPHYRCVSKQVSQPATSPRERRGDPPSHRNTLLPYHLRVSTLAFADHRSCGASFFLIAVIPQSRFHSPPYHLNSGVPDRRSIVTTYCLIALLPKGRNTALTEHRSCGASFFPIAVIPQSRFHSPPYHRNSGVADRRSVVTTYRLTACKSQRCFCGTP
jgi:hypothetical protein